MEDGGNIIYRAVLTGRLHLSVKIIVPRIGFFCLKRIVLILETGQGGK